MLRLRVPRSSEPRAPRGLSSRRLDSLGRWRGVGLVVHCSVRIGRSDYCEPATRRSALGSEPWPLILSLIRSLATQPRSEIQGSRRRHRACSPAERPPCSACNRRRGTDTNRPSGLDAYRPAAQVGCGIGPARGSRDRTDDATRRTQLASERTQLAWWRTGLTALPVSIGVGRLVPALDDSTVEWPYTLLGVAFALYGIALIAYGNLRGDRGNAGCF
jgi:Domain of unknown function (DUF202)